MAFDSNNAPLLVASPPPPVALNSPLENQFGMVKLQELKQKALDDARAMQAQEAFRTQLQQNGGDYDSALTALDKQGYNTIPIRGTIADYRKKLYENAKTHLDMQKTENEMMSGLMAGVDSQEKWDAVKPLVGRIDPQFVQQAGDQFDPVKFEQYKNIGTTAKEQHDFAQKSLENLANGNYNKAIANGLASTTDDADLGAFRKTMAAYGVPPDMVNGAVPPGTAWSPELVAKAKQATLTAKEVADIEEKKRDDLRIETQNDIANKRAEEQLKISRGHLGIAAAELKLRQAEAARKVVDPNAPVSAADQSRVNDILAHPELFKGLTPTEKGRLMPLLSKAGFGYPNPLTTQGQAMKETAQEMLPAIQAVKDEAAELDQLGLLGPIRGRWADIAANKIGASDLIPGGGPNARKLGKFLTDVGLLETGVARVHGGARGGGSPMMLEHMKAIMDAHGKDLDIFLGNLDSAQEWMGRYATMGGASPVASAPAAAPTTGAKTQKIGRFVVTVK